MAVLGNKVTECYQEKQRKFRKTFTKAVLEEMVKRCRKIKRETDEQEYEYLNKGAKTNRNRFLVR